MDNDIIPYWKQQEIAAKERKALQTEEQIRDNKLNNLIN